MTQKQSVFVVCQDFGLEGFGPPIRAFATEALAQVFVDGGSQVGGKLTWYCLALTTVADAAQSTPAWAESFRGKSE